MHTIFRLLIATAASIIAAFGAVAIILYAFDIQAPKLAAIVAVGTWIGVYKLIKPTKKVLIKRETKYVENYYPNGVLHEKGEIVFGKREGEWDIFNEEGLHIKTIVYEDGEEKYSRNANPF
jgi:hypothetical protein